MSRILLSAAAFFLVTTSLAIPVWGQATQGPPTAPIPSQIAEAKKLFISNLGEESNYYMANRNLYRGGADRAYNQFYDAMKSWGKYELVSAPADADLVFTILCQHKDIRVYAPEFRLLIIDPKTHITLWGITEYLEPAGMAKNREKNYDFAMAALVDDVKKIVATPSQPASK